MVVLVLSSVQRFRALRPSGLLAASAKVEVLAVVQVEVEAVLLLAVWSLAQEP